MSHRGTLTLFGIVLLALWVVGLAATSSSPGITWLDGAAGVLSLTFAAAIPDRSPPGLRASGMGVLSLGLFAIWLVGLISGSTPWQVWLTFIVAAVYAIGAAAAVAERRRLKLEAPNEREHPRRAA
jgi:hypothetical protein